MVQLILVDESLAWHFVEGLISLSQEGLHKSSIQSRGSHEGSRSTLTCRIFSCGTHVVDLRE